MGTPVMCLNFDTRTAENLFLDVAGDSVKGTFVPTSCLLSVCWVDLKGFSFPCMGFNDVSGPGVDCTVDCKIEKNSKEIYQRQ